MMPSWEIRRTVEKRYMPVEIDDDGRELRRMGPSPRWRDALLALSRKLHAERGSK